MAADEEDRSGYRGCVLTILIGSMESDALDAGVISHVLLVLLDGAAFELPAAGWVVYVIEGFAGEFQKQRHGISPFRATGCNAGHRSDSEGARKTYQPVQANLCDKGH